MTTAGTIVTGADPELTNVLLQQLAVILYAFQHKAEASQVTVVDTREAAVTVNTKPITHDCWVTHFKVEISEDGESWSGLGEYKTGLQAVQQVVSIPLQPLKAAPGKLTTSSSHTTLPASKAKFVRVTPLEWNGEGLFGPALRVSLLGPEVQSDAEEPSAESRGVVPLRTEAVVEAVRVLLAALGTLIDLSRKDEVQKELKQLEVKKVYTRYLTFTF